MDTDLLIKNANKTYFENFPAKTHFERAIFYSWSCQINNCKFCYMSTKPPVKEYNAVRSFASILAEVILCKHFGWKIGFVSGGVGALSLPKLEELLKYINQLYCDKVWINVGTVGKSFLQKIKPYIHGVIGTVECVNEEVHKFVCPSKPHLPIKRMFEQAKNLNLKTGATIIIGLGETKDDFVKLKKWINEYNLEKLHLYCFNPVKGTALENLASPSKEYQAWWIAQTRINFPKCDIQCGIWKDKIDRVSLLLTAGANSISKYPALKLFGKKESFELENQVKLAGRTFEGTLTKYSPPKIDLSFLPETLQKQIKEKLKSYLSLIERNLNKKKVSVQL